MTVVWTIAALLGLGLLVEGVSRSMAFHMYADLWLKEPLLQRKDDQMRAFARHGVDVLFLGSSATMCAIDPAVLRAHTGLSSYNAGVFRASMSYLSRWSQDFPLRRVSPRLVVIEGFLLCANDNSELDEHFQLYQRAPYFTSRRRIRLLYEWGYYLVTLRCAPLVAAPRLFVRALIGTIRTRRPVRWQSVRSLPGVIGPGGESVEHDEHLTFRIGPRLDAALQGMVRDWHVGGREWSAFAALVEAVRATGVQVLLLEPPYTAELTSQYFPGGLQAWEADRARFREFCAQLGVDWIDTAGVLEDSQHFSDPVHANLRGKTLFTVVVSNVLGPLLGRSVAPNDTAGRPA